MVILRATRAQHLLALVRLHNLSPQILQQILKHDPAASPIFPAASVHSLAHRVRVKLPEAKVMGSVEGARVGIPRGMLSAFRNLELVFVFLRMDKP